MRLPEINNFLEKTSISLKISKKNLLFVFQTGIQKGSCQGSAQPVAGLHPFRMPLNSIYKWHGRTCFSTNCFSQPICRKSLGLQI
jgi:hypothetical protein